jgi:hypothetical protein
VGDAYALTKPSLVKGYCIRPKLDFVHWPEYSQLQISLSVKGLNQNFKPFEITDHKEKTTKVYKQAKEFATEMGVNYRCSLAHLFKFATIRDRYSFKYLDVI